MAKKNENISKTNIENESVGEITNKDINVETQVVKNEVINSIKPENIQVPVEKKLTLEDLNENQLRFYHRTGMIVKV